ncbi:MAG: WYL domain-containing transcriptional regulator [Phycisphaerae bacterium]|nr:WYL domain-containing transcriptional regulator [Phycisphaerae bacterium]
MKTSRISRVIRLITALQSGRPYGASDLAEMLKISRRMVFRDLGELRKTGVPCSFDSKAQRYKIDPAFFLSVPKLNDQEALGLLLLAHKARNHIHFPFKDSTLRAALKIESDLPERTKRFCNTAMEKISIKTDPQERLDLLDQKFTQILKAILNKQIVLIHYDSPLERKCIVTNLSPYHLMYNERAWHALGKTELNKEVGVFKLNHIRELKTLNKYFADDKTFNLSEHIGRAWSMAPEGRLYNIKLKFLPEAARAVADVQWHCTQTVTFQDDGSAIIEFRVDGLNEITWWVLSYGDQVQVLAPASLRQKVVKIAQNMVKQNNQSLSV